MRGTTRDMSDKHEEHLVQVLGGRKTKGSGNQWNNPMDGRHDHREEEVALCWDGKSTLGKSIGVSLEMWEKAVEQSHGERPCIPLRFYLNERLTAQVDLVVLRLEDLVELLERSRRLSDIDHRLETGIIECDQCAAVFDADAVPLGFKVVHHPGEISGERHTIERA